MILNTLRESGRLRSLHNDFACAFDFLTSADLASLPDGRYNLDGSRVYAMVDVGDGKGVVAARLETHKKYIDIQFTLEGSELIGCGYAPFYKPDAIGWDFDKDICFLTGTPAFWVPVPEGSFAIFYPEEDAHAPLSGTSKVRKVVVKIEA